jgi:hypothetical protein
MPESPTHLYISACAVKLKEPAINPEINRIFFIDFSLIAQSVVENT